MDQFSAQILFWSPYGKNNNYNNVFKTVPGVTCVSGDKMDGCLILTVEATDRFKLSKKVGDTIRIADSLGVSFQSFTQITGNNHKPTK